MESIFSEEDHSLRQTTTERGERERRNKGEGTDVQKAGLETDFTTLSTRVFAFIKATRDPPFPCFAHLSKEDKYKK